MYDHEMKRFVPREVRVDKPSREEMVAAAVEKISQFHGSIDDTPLEITGWLVDRYKVGIGKAGEIYNEAMDTHFDRLQMKPEKRKPLAA